MTATELRFAVSEQAGVRSLVFFGFPLHPAGRSDAEVLDELADSFERWSAPLV